MHTFPVQTLMIGAPLTKVADLLQTRFGLQVTPGGLQHLLHRAARDARPAYEQLREQVRNAPVVTADETGWRVGAASYLRRRARARRLGGLPPLHPRRAPNLSAAPATTV